VGGMENKPLRFNKKRFFINGEFHEVVNINRAANILRAYNFSDNKVVTFSITDYNKFRQQAYTIGNVARLVGRDVTSVWKAIDGGVVSKPYMLPLKNNSNAGKGNFGVGRAGIYYFSEDNIYEIRDYFAGLHKGRPRIDGAVTSYKVPSIEELDAMLGKREMVYVKNKDGEYVPIWKRVDF
jgi:hypothetical protein